MNRQGNKVFIIYYHGFTEHRSIIHCYLPGQTAALMVAPCAMNAYPMSQVFLSTTLELPFNPTCLSFLPISPAQVPLPNLLYPPNPHPCSHSLPSSYTAMTSQIDLAISISNSTVISFCNLSCFFHHSRKIETRKVKNVTGHNPETAIIRLWHIASAF